MKKVIVLIMLLVAVASTASVKAEEQNSAEPIAEVCCILDHVLE